MNIEACYYLGYTSKVHGKQGELIIKLDVDYPEEYNNLESVLIQLNKKDSSLIPFFLSHAQVQNNGTLRIKIEDVDLVDDAKALVGKSAYLPLESLPKLTGNQFYFHEVKDFTVTDTNLGVIGNINQVLEYPSQSVFEIINANGKEILVPITNEVVIDVDRKNKNVIVTTPEGLVGIYLD